MEECKLGIMEMRFAQLIWEYEPVSSGELVRLCEGEFEWKKSTTYTMLRRLCQRGIFCNENGMVVSMMSREEFDALQSEKFVEEKFSGSLPRFLAAFTMRNKLSDKDIDELMALIEQSRRKNI
ncbi:MAG: BlaI/MecI/CopY family transcriptional regulator [Alistipes sp.]|nr:BlaI/MecI/CopY family transcriptional regulator [Alistipes sp.]